MKLTRINLTLSACALLLAAALPASAQNANSGEVKGTVTDVSNAVVPGATVTILNKATGVAITTSTNNDGLYDVPSVPPGSYSITFSKAGFRDSVDSNITVIVGTVALDSKLEIGAANEQVVVTADAPLVQTEDSGQRTDFDAKAVQDAPTVGGIWYNELTNVLPGVNGGGSQDASGQGIGINGTQAYSSSFLLEGSTATQPRDANASNNYPPIDAIGEVNVNTANFGAQYGNGVASFNVILKSGANRFHGSAFEFIQNDAFNARNYFNTGKAAPLRWNQYGGSIGGPIIKDKLFFYFTFQNNPATSSGVYFATVPTQGANGIASGVFPTTIIDPTTGLPFSNNTIPTDRLDPVALNIQKYFPAPNVAGTLVNNYSVVQTNPSTSRWYVGKIDYQVSANNRLSGSLEYLPVTLVNSIDAFCSLGFDCTKGNNYNELGQITDTWTINTTTVNEARIGNLREVDRYVPPTYGKGYPTTIGLQPTYGTNSPADIFPDITINSGGGIGGIGLGGGTHADLADGSLVESDVFTLIKGKHTIKIGGEFDKNYQNYTNWGDVSSGNFQFNGVSTGVPYADFLLGDVYGWYVYDYAETGARMWNLGAFVQDDFKASSKLTLNIGLRYQHQGGWGEVQNRWGTFSPTVVNTGEYVAPGTLGAITYGGQGGRGTIQDAAEQIAPRIGLSYAPSPTWAIRSSYGIFDTPWSTDPYTNAYGLGLNPRGSLGYGSTAAFQLKTGPPAGSVVYPSLSNLSNSQFNYQAVDYYPQKRPVTYYQEALLSVQHQIPGQVLLDVSYVFTKGTHQNFARDVNQVPESELSPKGINYAATPYPQYTSIQGHLFDGYSNYNALQLRAEKRLSHGLNFIVNYAWSKTMDAGTSSGHSAGVDLWQNAYNVAANYGLSTLDTRNTLNGSATYELPFGEGKHFALHGLVDEIAGGWRATGVFQVHSGIPFTPTVGSQDLSNSYASACNCGFAWFPNRVGNPSVAHPSISQWFNTAAYAAPANGTFGNAGRDSLTGPAWRDLDLSLGKAFQLIEGIRLEVRADSFNILNHPNFGQPSGSVGLGVAGGEQITSASGARQIQLGGRFTF